MNALLIALALVGSQTELKDVPYAGPGSSALQTLDTYPAAGSDNPVIVIVHGGGWSRGSKEAMAPICRNFARHSIAAVAVDYRLAPSAKHPDHAQDVAAAVKWTRSHAEDLGGDPDRIFLLGHSAGAHLAALAGLDDGLLAPGVLRGVIPVDTASFDLTDPTMGKRGMISEAFGDDPEVRKQASPLHHAQLGNAEADFLIPYVARREASSGRQSKDLAQALRAGGNDAQTYAATGKDHGSIMRGLGDPQDPVFELVLKWIGAR